MTAPQRALAPEPAPPRERVIIALALALLTGVSAHYVWDGAGMGMPAWDMTAAALFPHRHPDVPGDMGAAWGTVVFMWWVMMIAMMTPSAAPLVFLYRRVMRHHDTPAGLLAAATALLLAGYLAMWLAFSVAAAALQAALEPAGLLSRMMLWSRSAWLSAALLAVAGLYQWSPWKRRCLSQCRDPARYLARHASGGLASAFALGLRHGLYCVGCCALLMALLFVGGVMNVFWIAALSALVLAEKLLPDGAAVSRVSGTLLLLWAAATLWS